MREMVKLDTRDFASTRSSDEAILGESPNIIGYCPNCGEPITRRKGSGRQKVFCSKKCCDHYAYTHPNYQTWTGIEERVCEYCGQTYTTFRKNSQHRKYCSLSCSSKAAMERRRETHGLGDKKEPQSED